MADSNWEAECRALAQKAIDQLSGTCQSMHDLGPEYEAAQDNQVFCDVLDEAIFCCTDCGWWFEHPAQDKPGSGEWVCDDCFEEAGGELE
jgi:hypothetical protein